MTWTPIRDARGRRTAICRPGDLPPTSEAWLVRTVSSANMPYQTLVYLAAIYAIGGGALHWTGSAHALRIILTRLGVMLPLSFMAALLLSRAGAKRAQRACLHMRVCPSCGYDLKGARAESDGLAVCPECGAAWRL